MPIGIIVTTSNQNMINDGGYHEIHDIYYLNSPEHALETVKYIIDLNIKFTPNDFPLTTVRIECQDKETYKVINSYYNKEKYDNIKVIIGFIS